MESFGVYDKDIVIVDIEGCILKVLYKFYSVKEYDFIFERKMY